VIRLLISFAVWLAAAAVGLLVAKLVLDGVNIDFGAYVEVVVIFAVLQAVLSPFLTRAAVRSAPALLGGAGLFTTFVALLITDLISSGLSITGLDTWVFATLIVWLASMAAGFLLPFVVGRRAVQRSRDRRSPG
jgi:putative membrane protein